jgi:alpha-amylase
VPGSVRFVFCVHLHQPVNNFEHVMRRIYDECYGPFLEVMERHPGVAFVLHVSGVLYDWFQEHQPDYLVRLKHLVDTGRLELLGGGYYEPILAMLPSEDAVGQLKMMNDFLRATFEVEPKGAWLAERVWEPHLPSWLAAGGIKTVVLDDAHFVAAGLGEERLDAPYLTEDRGRLLTLWALREPLRYAIPFKEPAWTIRFLRERAREDGRAVVVYADDGEKFGAWPGTHKHVYAGGWLESFLTALEQHAGVIRTCTLAQALEAVPPAGRIYLPSCSYREMGEWSLLAEGRDRFRELKRELERADRWTAAARHFTGGQWRNFRVRYPEANLMYARMLGLSRRIAELGPRAAARPELIKDLYQAQCNTAYWHGLFGGIYASHLRGAVYAHLLRAERTMELSAGSSLRYPASRLEDFDLDGREDLRLYNPAINLFLRPSGGGQIFELDVRSRDLNLLATLARHREGYHEDWRSGPALDPALREEIGRHARPDATPRGSLIDHCYSPDASAAGIESGEAERGDFAERSYELKLSRGGGRLEALLSAVGSVGAQAAALSKAVRIERDECAFQAEYTLTNRSDAPLALRFGIEFNTALLSPIEPAAFFHVGDGASCGDLRARVDRDGEKEWWIHDEPHALEIGWVFSRPCRLIAFPVQTVSLSERGFELTYQSTVVLPTWEVRLEPGDSWTALVTQRVVRREEKP